MASSDRARIPSEQRVFSLVLALVSSPQGLTKQALLSTVFGYAERFRVGDPDAALERQFERDKEQLRALGIPVEAIDAPGEPGNTQTTRYRIAKQALQADDAVRFTAAELALLRLASLAWREGSLTAEARRSSMKLESMGAGIESHHIGIAPRLGLTHPAAALLQRAIDDQRVVRFDYATPGQPEPYPRRVAPLRLHLADRRWHVIAYDLDREAMRVFLLSRITSGVKRDSQRARAEWFEQVDAQIAQLEALRAAQTARVAVRPGSIAEARLAGDREESAVGAEYVEIGTLDYLELARELAGYGDDVTVISPQSVHDDVRKILSEVRDAHA